jgi:hypothetical protein
MKAKRTQKKVRMFFILLGGSRSGILCKPFPSYTPIYSLLRYYEFVLGRDTCTVYVCVCLFVGDWILEQLGLLRNIAFVMPSVILIALLEALYPTIL